MSIKHLYKLVVFLFVLFLRESCHSQVVYQDLNNSAIYDFLDELANEKIIQINSVVKPWSRKFIAEKLIEAKDSSAALNKRQLSELNFYLKDYNKEILPIKYPGKRFDVFYYKDSLFTFSLNSILGGQAWNNKNGFNYDRWYGANFFSYAGDHFGMYASLRDHSVKEVLADTGYISTRSGGVYRLGDFSEMQGGITWGWNWGEVALVKEYINWGNSYRFSNIIGSKGPSFAQFRIHLKPADWFEFNYLHGWLVSGVVDSSRSYTTNGRDRTIYHSKYISANMFTFIPWKYLNLSVGNSVIYSDQNINPAYFIPVFFYKSVDHSYYGSTNYGGQNSQMFIDFSSRLIKNVHLYYSMFIDVLSFSTIFDKERHANHWSMLGGMRWSNLLPNTSLTLEYIHNNVMVYKNDNLTTLYNSNWYYLGHYLGDNAQELYMNITFKPYNTLHIDTWFSIAQKGPDLEYDRSKNPDTGIPYVHGNDFLTSVEWQKELLGGMIKYQPINDVYVFVELEQQFMKGNQERYNAPYFQGDLLTFSFGVNMGF